MLFILLFYYAFDPAIIILAQTNKKINSKYLRRFPMFKKIFFNKLKIYCLLGLISFLTPLRAQFNYSDFNNTAGLALKGNATVINNQLLLTSATKNQKAAVWHKTRQAIDTSSTTWQFRISSPSGLSPGGADGIVLVIQNYHDSALGNSGGNLAYNIPKSLAVEFDTWDNSEFNDPSRPHISVQIRGLTTNNPSHNYSLGCKTGLNSLADGAVHTVRINYARPYLKIFLDDMFTPKLSVTVNLADTIGTSDHLA